ncbi:Clp protease N-terminal domain-containing protein [Microbacterium sp. IEGM 1404]|uniref:Clp protease N-terminal domain-containing protein n=1 Tax=Microbacterium sp. IEGM 1404 TaxID=3047084 RepID=UPI0024B65A1A|nr:Clp protease N-terminal domain-containing protein [Microbacterium sp. IEGM 1404]MDI9891276.1 Clp protease N-terminal domain-containing protein [Microbacterium sp. IEGM 1404]
MRWTSFNARTQVVVWEAGEEAPDSFVDTGRLLLALAASRGSIASGVLAAEGIDLMAFAHLVAHSGERGPRGSMSAFAIRSVRSASAYADTFGHPAASTGHLLLGILDELDGVAMLVLQALGVERRHLVARTRAHLDAARAAGALDERGLEEDLVLTGTEVLRMPPSQAHAVFLRRAAGDPTLAIAVAPDGVVEVARTFEGDGEFALCFRLEDAVDTTIEWMVSLRVTVYSATHRETLVADAESKLDERSRQIGELLKRLVVPEGPRPDAAEVRP